MIRQILFPTDFSKTADHAFPAALELASRFGAELTTVHAFVEPYVPKGYMTRTLKEIVDQADFEEFELYRDQLPKLHEIASSLGKGDIPIRHAFFSGKDIIHQLLTAAEKEKSDLMVMGTTGARGVEEFFQGTVASEVMENAPCPVLILPEAASRYPVFKRIAFAAGLEPAEEGVLSWLKHFAQPLQAEIIRINLPGVDETDFEIYQTACGDEADETAFVFCDCWKNDESMAAFLESREIDLLALATHKTSFIQELFRQNVEKQIARHLPYPILGIPVRQH
ncbi:MAG: universal stress protein [Haliscomenobacter sp.]|nr:universal stress protein [Haliscomenobacter sp.]MBK8652880.1 universal stress protein [Haliscomenobacter sp.]MBP9076403.1 universal stress protein [Haliscomenobacter sp.]